MRFEHQGMSLDYSVGERQRGRDVTASAVLGPPDPANRVQFHYRIGDGDVRTVLGRWFRNDLTGDAQHFTAVLPGTDEGDVEVWATATCAGRAVPSEADLRERATGRTLMAVEETPVSERATGRRLTAVEETPVAKLPASKADGGLEPAERVWVSGVVRVRDGDGVPACRVEAVYEYRYFIGFPEGPGLRARGRAQATTDAVGQFSLRLPPPIDTVAFTAYSPAGVVIGRVEVSARMLGAQVVVLVDGTPTIKIDSVDPGQPRTPVKLIGRVFDLNGKQVPGGLQVVVWEKHDDTGVPILLSRTNAGGYFTSDYPDRVFDKVAVSVAKVKDPVPVVLAGGKLPNPLLIGIHLPCPSEEKCGCGSPEADTPRLPDQWDLDASGAYTADLGAGGCVRFTIPNRSLEEYDFYSVVRTTEPQIHGTSASDGMTPPPSGGSPGQPPPGRPAVVREPGRAELTADNVVDWDSDPTFYQATTIAHGHLLHFKQVWQADGYSLGDLLYSLPLAPGQKRLIAVLDWERREQARRDEGTTFSESLKASLARDRDITEVVSGALTENVRGGSKASTWGVGAGTGAAGNGSYQGFNFGALLGISGGYGASSAEAWQDSARAMSASSLQRLRDTTLQSASAFRGLRSSVVSTVTQGEAVTATTEAVANHNRCHALTIQYFEVLRHLKVTQELTDVQECLFVPLQMSSFDEPKILRWRESLVPYLRRAELAGAFDATRRKLTRWQDESTPAGRYGDEEIISIHGEAHLTFHIPLPPLPPPPSADAWKDAQALGDALNPTAGFLGPLLAIASGGMSLVAGAANKAILQGTQHVAESLARDEESRYDRFQHDVMPGVAAGFVDQLDLYAVTSTREVLLGQADFSLVAEYQPGAPLLVGIRARVGPGLRRAEVTHLTIRSRNGLPTECRVIVNDARFSYRTGAFEHPMADDGRVNDDIDLPKIEVTVTPKWPSTVAVKTILDGTGASIDTPIDEWEQRNPRKEDVRLATELCEHLNDNLEYYHHALWWTMDPNRRFMLLDGFSIPYAGGRSVASVVENSLIGIVGNSLVMPVARGVHLDPRFSTATPELALDLLSRYQPEMPAPPSRVSLPTRGVYAEAVMGVCNSCERAEDNRGNWEDAPLDEVPAIGTTSTDSRRAQPEPTTPTAFPNPIVAIQAAPAAPDPSGIKTVAELLAKQAFGDITGLSATQAAAAAAYQKALDTAATFGKEASTLAQQAAMLKGIDRSTSAIDQAHDNGKITDDQSNSLYMSALKKMVGADSGMSGKEAQERLDIVDGAAKKGSIGDKDRTELNRKTLDTLVIGEPAKPEAEAAARKVDEIEPGAVDRVEISEPGKKTVISAKRENAGRRIGMTLTSRFADGSPFPAQFDLSFRNEATDTRVNPPGILDTDRATPFAWLSGVRLGSYSVEGQVRRIPSGELVAHAPVTVLGPAGPIHLDLDVPFSVDITQTLSFFVTGDFKVTPQTTSIALEAVPILKTEQIETEIHFEGKGAAELTQELGAKLSAKLSEIFELGVDWKGGLKLSGEAGAAQTVKFTGSYQRVTGIVIHSRKSG